MNSSSLRRLWREPLCERFSRRGAFRIAVLLVALAALLGANKAGRLTLDPVHYAAAARQMAEGGDWVVPEFAGEPYLKKPPLVMWLSAASMTVFGITPWNAALPAVLLGVIGVILAARLAERLFDKETALLATIVLCTSYTFHRSARTFRLETIVVATTLGALLVYLYAAERERCPRWTGFAFFGLLAAGFLGKLYVGLLPLALVLIGVPRRKVLLSPWFWAGLVAFIVPVGAWLLGVHARLGPDWTLAFAADVSEYGGKAIHLGEFLNRMVFDTFLYNLPWSILMVFGLGSAVRTLLRGSREEKAKARLLLTFVLVIALGSIGKQNQFLRYWVPAFPAFAILAAKPVRDRLQGRDFSPLAAGIVGIVLLASVLFFLVPIRTSGKAHRLVSAAPAIARSVPKGERIAYVGDRITIGRQATLYFYSGRWAEHIEPAAAEALRGTGRLALLEEPDLEGMPPGIRIDTVYLGRGFRLARLE